MKGGVTERGLPSSGSLPGDHSGWAGPGRSQEPPPGLPRGCRAPGTWAARPATGCFPAVEPRRHSGTRLPCSPQQGSSASSCQCHVGSRGHSHSAAVALGCWDTRHRPAPDPPPGSTRFRAAPWGPGDPARLAGCGPHPWGEAVGSGQPPAVLGCRCSLPPGPGVSVGEASAGRPWAFQGALEREAGHTAPLPPCGRVSALTPTPALAAQVAGTAAVSEEPAPAGRIGSGAATGLSLGGLLRVACRAMD